MQHYETSRRVGHGAFGLASVLLVCLAVLAFAGPAMAAGPKPGAHYFGFPGQAIANDGFVDVTGDLRVSRSGLRIAPARLAFSCGRSESPFQVRLSGPAGWRAPVRVGRDGSFAATGRVGRLGRYRLHGRFVTRDFARVVYTERRVRSGRLVCRSRMKLYRNGVPPFSGCRSQRAHTDLWADSGRVFQQYTRETSGGGEIGLGSFFTHHYACLFESPSKRIDLGRNYDDERRGNFRLAGPFVAFFSGGCAACSWDQWSVEVRDVRDGSLVSRPDVRYWTRLSDLELKANGSVAWTLERLALRPDGYPIGYQTEPPVIETREVWALDSQGQRLLDSGPELVSDSLDLDDSTLTWTHGASMRTATLD
jgi:hypothetical protein